MGQKVTCRRQPRQNNRFEMAVFKKTADKYGYEREKEFEWKPSRPARR